MYDKLVLYVKENMDRYNTPLLGSMARKAKYSAYAETCAKSMAFDEECLLESRSIDEYIDSNKDENKFQKLLFKYIDRNNLKDSDVYNKVHIDRRLFSKIRSDSNYHPSKETVILLAIALELNEDELEDLLLSASYSLPRNNEFDLIIRFCFQEKLFDLIQINDYLDRFHCKLLA